MNQLLEKYARQQAELFLTMRNPELEQRLAEQRMVEMETLATIRTATEPLRRLESMLRNSFSSAKAEFMTI